MAGDVGGNLRAWRKLDSKTGMNALLNSTGIEAYGIGKKEMKIKELLD